MFIKKFFSNYFKLHYWPILTCVWFLVGFLITFIISMLENHVNVPFISDTGTTPPESCIFGQILNVGALLFIITMYVHYRQVKIFQLEDGVKLRTIWNTLGLVFGILTAIGISIVGNFQETAVLSIHLLGASTTFGCGTTYICIQTVIFYYFRHIYFDNPECKMSSKHLYLRIVLSMCCVIFLSVAGIFLLLGLLEFTGDNIACWKEEDGGFAYKVVATFSEWVLAFCFMIYILSTTKEYKLLEFENIRFKNKFAITSKSKIDDNTNI